MNATNIQVVQERGTHYQVGLQIGAALQAQIARAAACLRHDLPTGVTWEMLLDHSRLYLQASREVFPQYIEELQGIAEGSGQPFEEIFLLVCEELWEAAAWREPRWNVETLERSNVQTPPGRRGCTDLAARGRATLDGATLIGHTNDLLPSAQEDLVILKVQAGDEPQFLAISSGGVGLSAGFNAAGISLTGNQLDNNDIRPGVPRLLVVRAILASRRLSEAIDLCLLPQRASSYNNVIADTSGEVYSMEGSATACAALYIHEDVLAHANHYTDPAMLKFEADPSSAGNSIVRHNRALRLLRENYGRLTPQLMQTLLADHANYPTSICKHGLETVTVFSIVIHLNSLTAWIGVGRACEAKFEEYKLERWNVGTLER
jgi:isopenicillin-N N-acyltransferase-like protein